MQIIKQLIILVISIGSFAVVNGDLYQIALQELENFNSLISTIEDGYRNKVQYLPEYDKVNEVYAKEPLVDFKSREFMLNNIIPKLEQLSISNADALVTLGDIYIFGNYSMQTNYTKALEYYERAISLKSNGHAYFMLGFIYSTGMFGEIEINHPKAQLYYQLGVENNDVNALLVMAYRLSEGIYVPKNCELSLIYYSRLAELGYNHLIANDNEIEPTEILFNVKIPDFIGGIYGSDVSESANSVATSKKKYLESYEQDFTLDTFDSRMILTYFSALDAYDGYYDSPKNFTKAVKLLKKCINYGQKLPTFNKPSKMAANDKFRFSKCLLLLGHMYLKGQGIEQDYNKAFKYLQLLTKYHNNSDALSDLGYIYENNLIKLDETPEQIELKATDYYVASHNDKSDTGARRLSQQLMKKVPFGDLMASENRKDIVSLMKDAASRGDTEALYHFGGYIESGVTQGITKLFSCHTNILYYKVFIERLSSFFYPHLKYAFNEMNIYNYKNALVGYLIAAEQGIEKAQISSGWLLYQLDPFPIKNTKKYDHSRVKSAMEYFKRASDQGDTDTTIFLGDIYFYGVESANITHDYEKAFNLYTKAANLRSPHGCFSLAYMYEHGLGIVNNTIDYFMAKRYYDLSLKYRTAQNIENNIPIYFALLKLRIKYLIWGQKFNQKEDNVSWFSNFKNLGAGDNNNNNGVERQDQRARQQHEGTNNDNNNQVDDDDDDFFYTDDLELADYLVLIFFFIIFATIMARGLITQYRRFRGIPIPNDNNNNNNFGINANIQRGNFEFHFFAI